MSVASLSNSFADLVQSPSTWHSLKTPKSQVTKQAHLHVVIPASQPGPNLCKLLLSLEVLGYPTPVLINWGKEYNEPGLVEGGSHLAKITGIADYLDSLSEDYDEDIVLMVDGE